MALEAGSVWMPKGAGGHILKIVKIENNEVECEEGGGSSIILSIRSLINNYVPPFISLEYVGPIEYGGHCGKCNRKFEYQTKNAIFVCWACKNGA